MAVYSDVSFVQMHKFFLKKKMSAYIHHRLYVVLLNTVTKDGSRASELELRAWGSAAGLLGGVEPY